MNSSSSSDSDAHLRALLERVFELAASLADDMEGEFEAQGLTRARAELLWRLGAVGQTTQRALSEALQCTPRNVTGLVDGLETAGLAQREPHPADRRATLVTLTDDGRNVLARWRTGYEQLAHRLFDSTPPEELRGFEATLERMLDRLRERPS